jgi:hypothetical protein
VIEEKQYLRSFMLLYLNKLLIETKRNGLGRKDTRHAP